MPKDPSKNVDRYKVRGGHLNEYQYEQEKAAEKKATDKRNKATDKRPQKSTARKATKKK